MYVWAIYMQNVNTLSRDLNVEILDVDTVLYGPYAGSYGP